MLKSLQQIPSHLIFSSEDSLVVPGPSQTSANPATGRREDSLPAVSPSQMSTNLETGRSEDYLPAVGPSQMLDHANGPIMTGQRQMFNPSSLIPNERPVQPPRPVWDATLEGLFPGMGPSIPGLRPPVPGLVPPANPWESSSTMQSGVGDERARDPYHQSQDFEEWNPEGEDGGDESDEDEVGNADDDYDDEYRFPRNENDNCWYDDDQEEIDV